jgi:hypothetical protein
MRWLSCTKKRSRRSDEDRRLTEAFAANIAGLGTKTPLSSTAGKKAPGAVPAREVGPVPVADSRLLRAPRDCASRLLMWRCDCAVPTRDYAVIIFRTRPMK